MPSVLGSFYMCYLFTFWCYIVFVVYIYVFTEFTVYSTSMVCGMLCFKHTHTNFCRTLSTHGSISPTGMIFIVICCFFTANLITKLCFVDCLF